LSKGVVGLPSPLGADALLALAPVLLDVIAAPVFPWLEEVAGDPCPDDAVGEPVAEAASTDLARPPGATEQADRSAAAPPSRVSAERREHERMVDEVTESYLSLVSTWLKTTDCIVCAECL